MSFDVTLALDLNGATESQIAILESELLNRHWVRYDDGTNYCTNFVGEPSDSEILSVSQDDLNAAAKRAALESWDGVCLIANSREEPDLDDPGLQCSHGTDTVIAAQTVAAS